MSRLCLLTGLAALGFASSLEAQATADEARLVFTVGAGYVGGGDLWSVSGQPIRVSSGFTDTLGLSRTLRPGLGVVFSGTYFPGTHLGFGGEVLLLGLGTEDGCTVEFTSGDPDTQEICTSIAATDRRATSVALSGSLVYRFMSKEAISPYARLNLGAVITQQSLIKVTGQHSTSQGPADVPIYIDDSPDRVHPYVGLGLGMTAAAGKGYQFRLEIRDNYVRLPIPAGPTIHEALQPETTTKGKHVFSLMIGFDIVLERKRGRRY
jgi:hypothetical protein